MNTDHPESQLCVSQEESEVSRLSSGPLQASVLCCVSLSPLPPVLTLPFQPGKPGNFHGKPSTPAEWRPPFGGNTDQWNTDAFLSIPLLRWLTPTLLHIHGTFSETPILIPFPSPI